MHNPRARFQLWLWPNVAPVLVILGWFCLTGAIVADEPKVTKNADGSTATTEKVSFENAFKGPFVGGGEKRTTRDKDGNLTKIEWVRIGKKRQRLVVAVFVERNPKSNQTTVATYTYGKDGTLLSKKEEVYNKNGALVLDREEAYFQMGKKTTPAAPYIFSHSYKGEGLVGGQLDHALKDLQNKWGSATPAPEASPPSVTPSPSPKELTPATISSLILQKKVTVAVAGTGQTIGNIANITVQNQTNQPVSVVIPAMVLESSSGKNQHYACPKEQTVELGPKQSKTVPMDGVCINRHKPPVGKGVTGDLVINTGDPTAPQEPGSHVPAKDANKLLRIAKSKYDAADKLQKDGELKDMPYHDPQKQKDIVVQWSTWSDPDISEIVGGPPATKDDLKKVVYKQVEENGPMTPETKKKVDQGIDTIFEKVELTSKKAKDLEEPDQYAETEAMPPNTVEIADHTGSPTTQESPKSKGTEKDKEGSLLNPGRRWPKSVRRWIEQKKSAAKYDRYAKESYRDLLVDLDKYCSQKSPEYRELKEKRDKAAKKARANNASQADKDNFKKLDHDLEKLRSEFTPGFAKTKQGKKDYKQVRGWEKMADWAREQANEAGKKIDPMTKAILEKEVAKENEKQKEWEKAQQAKAYR
jgi:hypothetical protein